MPPAEEEERGVPTLPGARPETRPPRSGASVSRAFVVEVAVDAQHRDGPLRGRVQHLATSDGGNFESGEGLLAIIGRVLDRSSDSNRTRPGSIADTSKREEI